MSSHCSSFILSGKKSTCSKLFYYYSLSKGRESQAFYMLLETLQKKSSRQTYSTFKRNIELNIQGINGRTKICSTCSNGHKDVVKILKDLNIAFRTLSCHNSEAFWLLSGKEHQTTP